MIAENEQSIPAVVSVAGMARLLNLSRSRLYQLITQGVFIGPTYTTENSRPLYTAEMATTNIAVKRTGIGVNGKPVMFYASRNSSYLPSSDNSRRASNSSHNNCQYRFLKGGLSTLGQSNVSDAQIELAIRQCFPEGTDNIEQGKILKTVYLFLKHRTTE